MRIFKAFGSAFLVFLGVYLLYFNLVMALNVVGEGQYITPFVGLFSASGDKWTDGFYIGFSTFFGDSQNNVGGVFTDFPRLLEFNNLLDSFVDFVDSFTNFKGVLQGFNYNLVGSSAWEQLLQVFYSIFRLWTEILIAPFKMIISFITLFAKVFQTIIELLKYIKDILGGKYNTPISGWSSPLENYFGNSGYNPNISGATAPHGEVSVSGGIVVFQ